MTCNLKLDDIKNFTEKLLSKNKEMSIAKIKSAIEESFQALTISTLVFQFSILLKQMGYQTKNNKVIK